MTFPKIVVMMVLLSISIRSCRGFRSSSFLSSRSRAAATSWSSLRSQASSSVNIITSPKSQTVKKIQALLSKRKQRLKFGQTVVEGPRMVFDLLDNPKTTHLVKQVLVSARDYELREDYRNRLFGDNEHKGGNSNLLVQLVHPDIFSDCTDTMTPQGIVAIVDIPDEAFAANNAEVASGPAAPMYLVLDGVSDPGNLGTLLRTSLAVGVAGVVLLPDCCDVWNPKAVRSAMGASFQIPILEYASWGEAKSQLRDSKGVKKLYAATMIEPNDGDASGDSGSNGNPKASIPYFEVNWTEGASALVIGSEGNGLSPTIRQDLLVFKRLGEGDGSDDENGSKNVRATHIPMEAGIESLNAAVCGSVILFEYARQCRQVSTKHEN
mmetsp:Transcript_15820/g.36453  ORF Transcript_15820/g.36453 Transcript_15820/m.36453 type:complete len:380 (-) Transcript_15820:385-1524(-)